MTRQKPSLQLPAPDDDLRRFPVFPLNCQRELWRVVRDGHGAWWFGSSLEGRFDLQAPKGTCYLASDDLGAILEILGPDLLPGGMAPLSFLHARHLAALRVPHEHRLANCLVQRATQWVTAEISTLTPYTIPMAWALAWDRNGLQGVRYAARHSASRRTYAIALFGAAGERHDWSNGRTCEITTNLIRRLRDRCGITLFETPAADELIFVK